MHAGAKGGSQRGAGGTPYALALAWAWEEAARLSPALPLVCLLAQTQLRQPLAQATQCESLRPSQQNLSQAERPHTCRQTCSSACTSACVSQAAQSVASEFISTASERRGKAEVRTAVMEQADADAVTAMAEAALASQSRPQHLHMQFQAEAQIAEVVSEQAAESQQGQKHGGRAKQPPKPKQPVRRK